MSSLHVIRSFGQWESDQFRQSLCHGHSVLSSAHWLVDLEQPPPLFFCSLGLEDTDKAWRCAGLGSATQPRRRVMPRFGGALSRLQPFWFFNFIFILFLVEKNDTPR